MELIEKSFNTEKLEKVTIFKSNHIFCIFEIRETEIQNYTVRNAE